MKYLLYLSCSFLLYFSFGLNSLDTQPTAFFISIFLITFLILTNKTIQIPKSFSFFLIFLIYLTFLFLKNGNSSSAIRIFTYTLIYPAVFIATINYPLITKSFLRFIILFWFFGVIIQYFSPEIINFFIGEVRFYEGLSFTSFSPEPVWFGRTNLFLLLIYLMVSKENKLVPQDYFYILLITFMIFLSGSFTIYIYFILIIIILNITSFNLRSIFTSITIFIITISVLERFQGIRASQVISSYQTSGYESLSEYGAFSTRVLNAPLAVKSGLFETFLLGNGFDISLKKTEFDFFGYKYLKYHPNSNGTISGGLISLIYYFGIVGMIWLIIILSRVYNRAIHNNSKKIFFCILIISFFEGSLSNPMIPFSFGCLFILNNYEQN